MYAFLADVIVVLHFLFVIFVVAGALLVLRWPKVAWVHLPSATWAALLEFFGWICPLTPLEIHLRRLSGRGVYETGFVEHYILPVLYPPALTVNTQAFLGLAVVVINGSIYFFVLRRRRKR